MGSLLTVISPSLLWLCLSRAIISCNWEATGAGNGTRTRMILCISRRILSSICLPIPTFRHIFNLKLIAFDEQLFSYNSSVNGILFYIKLILQPLVFYIIYNIIQYTNNQLVKIELFLRFHLTYGIVFFKSCYLTNHS